ncbi:hypothetical protein U746_3118 [Mycolicibacterium mucogenicum 261Sha1.1M5]|nr:hypothetical protein U746_3118 [Mycolicibacterium mucogenicum 261Sha1.1M5]
MPKGSPLRRLAFGCVLALLFLSAFALGVTLGTAYLPEAGQYLRDWLKSPAVAGLGAIVAATIAFFGLKSQSKIALRSLERSEKADEYDRWQQLFEWTADRAVPRKSEDMPLPPEALIGTLTRLVQTSPSPAQQLACRGVMDVIVLRVRESEKPEPSAHDSLINDALSEYASTSLGTSASSPQVRDLLYSRAVIAALLQNPDYHFVPPATFEYARSFDGVVFIGSDEYLLVSRESHPSKNEIYRTLKALSKKYGRKFSALIVTKSALADSAGVYSEVTEILVTKWEPDDGPNYLWQSIADLRAAPASNRSEEDLEDK